MIKKLIYIVAILSLVNIFITYYNVRLPNKLQLKYNYNLFFGKDGTDLKNYIKKCNESDMKLKDSQLCPCLSNYLTGKIIYDEHGLSYANNQSRLVGINVSSGGRWSPPCKARQNLALIIPFRDRSQHLKILLNILHPFLQRQLMQYTIFVVEQASPRVFNKASIMNVGFLKANLTGNFDCFIFHDVDMLPQDDRNLYMCGDQPIHLGTTVDKFNYKPSDYNPFGGVIALRRWHFEKVNGFSNQFYGWGGEDDEMCKRIISSGLSIEYRLENYHRYTMIKHQKDRRNPDNKDRGDVHNIRLADMRKKLMNDGLNNIKYHIIDKQFYPLYTWFLVDLPEQYNQI